MTYNVEFQQWDDSGTVSTIGQPDADIVCLQEVTPSWESVIREEYGERYPHMLFHVFGDEQTGGLGVASRYPLTDQGVRPGPNGWHPAWHVLVDTPAGALQILDIHLRSMFDGRSSSVESYLKVDADHLVEIKLFSEECEATLPTIVAGDFNEDPDGPAIGYLEREGFRNVLPLYRPGQFTWRHRSVADQFTKTLDHVLFNDALEPLNAWVVSGGASDHLPVVAHFEAAYQW
jgi:endonuclease/exonuclease/phosphatase family metal-dependent hydrolase